MSSPDNARIVEEGDRARDGGDFESALIHYRQLMQGQAERALGHFKIGTVRARQGRDDEAEQSYREAIDLRPGYPEAINNLALLVVRHGDYETAELCYRELLADQPDYFESHINLGNVLLDLGRFTEAHYHFRRATILNPASALAYDRLGAALKERRRLFEAIDAFRQALDRNPSFHRAWNNLGGCHFDLGNHEQADDAFCRSLELDPDQSEAWSNRLLLSNFQTLPRDVISTRHRRYGEHMRAKGGAHVPSASWAANGHIPERRLRIGFVSGDFRRHSVAYFLPGALGALDRSHFELFAYSTYRVEDAVTERLKPLFSHWRLIDGVSDDSAAGWVRDDAIDILVDLSGHTNHNRLGLFARRAAPLQVSWLGYPNTTGLDAIDYRLTDALADPEDCDNDALYTERLVRLPGSFLCFTPPDEADELRVPDRSERAHPLTFGSFNARVKIGESCIALWAETLRAVPEARLVIKTYHGVDTEAERNDLLARFASHGIAAGRIVVAPPLPALADHLAAYGEIDIALDTFPYHGTTTTCEALWMGVPVVTLAGDRHASRVGAALLGHIGLSRCVAHSPQEFVAIVGELAADRRALGELKSSLRERMRNSPLCDAQGMGRQLAEAFRQMWRELCRSDHSMPDDAAAMDSAPSSPATLIALLGRGDHAALLEESERVLAGDPLQPLASLVLAHKARTVSLIALGRCDEAYAAAVESARLAPEDAEVLGNLGIAAAGLKRWREAATEFSRALDRRPDDPELLEQRATCELLLGNADKAERDFSRSVGVDPKRPEAWFGWLFAANFHSVSREEVFSRHRQFGDMVRKRLDSLSSLPPPIPLDQGSETSRKVRIGFVSGDLGRHSVAYFLLGPLARIDRDAFELLAYSTASLGDDLTRRLKSLFDVWRDIDPADPESAARTIRQDGVDVLFDLAGPTANNGLLIFAHRPAPLQVAWLGYPNTTGLDGMDFRLTDAVVDPGEDDDRFHTERLFRLSRPFLAYEPPGEAPPVGPLPMQRQGHLSFGSLNTRAKLGEETLRLWCAVLERVPDSRLILKSYSGLEEDAARQELLGRFAAFGIDPGRVEIRPFAASIADHLAVYGDIDIGLDSFPYNGTTTTCEALWMGVPVLTLAGDRHASRVGAMLLGQAGLPECVATTPDQFVRRALELAGQPEALAKIRAGLRDRLLDSPLLDHRAMAEQFGEAVRTMLDEQRRRDNQPDKPQPTANRAATRSRSHSPDADTATLMKLVESGRHEESALAARRILQRRPGHAFATRALSFALIGLGRYQEALPILSRGVARHSKDPELLNNLGIVLSELMRWEEAVKAFRRALVLAADDPEIHRNLGAAYYRMHRWAEAIPPLLKAIELHPGDYIDAIGLLALSLLNGNRNEEALVCFDELIKSYPNDAYAHYLYAKAAAHQCRWGDLEESHRRIWLAADTEELPPLDTPFSALSMEGVTSRRILRIARSHAEKITGRITPAVISAPKRDTGRPLRVGYLSGDLRAHPVGYVLPRVIELHDRRRVESWGLSVGPDEDSAARRRLVAAFDHFLDLERVSIDDTVARLRSLPLDILVDLSGWTTHGRQEATAFRCAPVQVNWLGYAGTMGKAALADYIVCDAIVLPPDQGVFYSEQPAWMPHTFMPSDPGQAIPDAPTRAEEGLPDSALVFCSFNSPYKFNPRNFDVWCRLLRDVPGSVLWLASLSATGAENLRREAQARGVAPDRIVIARFAESRASHLARISLADIALDPFPYNSHSSGVEMLMAGVPMVSLLGETFAGRVGASLLGACGMSELVAHDPEAYFQLALRLATNAGERAAVRSRLAQTLPGSPLLDMESFARDLENLYERMWQDVAAGRRRPLMS